MIKPKLSGSAAQCFGKAYVVATSRKDPGRSDFTRPSMNATSMIDVLQKMPRKPDTINVGQLCPELIRSGSPTYW